jgi:hypothetical protein
MEQNGTQSPGLEEWLAWDRRSVAGWVSACGEPLVVGWPFNGTRRWYLLHRRRATAANGYVDTIIHYQAEKHRLLFSLGAGAILAPCFGYGLLKRGEDYTRGMVGALLRLGDEPVNQDMFGNGVRLGFYGDYEEVLDTPTLRPMLEACHELTARTSGNEGPLLMLGLFADSPYEQLARISVDFARRRGRPPGRKELVREYYGVEVPDLGLYLGFAQPAVFDVPLVATGQENLYATLNPSPEVTERQLREILYDHLILRKAEEVDYEALPEESVRRLEAYNEATKERTLGVGSIDPDTGLWNPRTP